jgi:dTDP-4-dehydrorhamnose reductase
MKTKVLVTGANGQLGSELKELSRNISDIEFLFHDIDTLDLTDFDKVEKFLEKEKPEFIINCAAYTAVDKAEEETKMAMLINSAVPENLAKLSVKYKAKFIHVSTDYVFNGKTYFPYKEMDNTEPESAYGKTKLEGEKCVESVNPESIIIRTSWLYSSFGNNFVKTMLRLGKEREQLNVIFDQVGTPTYARDLASAIIKIINAKTFEPGIYHYSNEGVCSWFDFAYEIITSSQLNCKVFPIETKDYPLPAKRPQYSVLNKTKIKHNFNIEIPHWKDSLHDCLKILNN